MQPLRTSHWSMQFASALSPWWLLLALPLAVALAWWLYRRQAREVRRFAGLGLTILRAALFALLVFLLFRPSLLRRDVLTWPGRLLIVVDDSASMGVADNAADPAEALRLTRFLDSDFQPRDLHDQADRVAAARDALHRFQRLSRDAESRDDAFWVAAEAAQAEIAAALDGIADDDLRQQLAALFTGDQHPGYRAFEQVAEKLDKRRQQLLDQQAEADRQALAAGDTQLRPAVEAFRARPRLELVEAAFGRAPAEIDGQYLRRVELLAGTERGLRDELALNVAPGRTDLIGGLRALVEAESPFPLSGIVLLSDGRDLGGEPLTPLARECARRQIPVYAIGVGSANEPIDLAVTGVRVAPFAVVGQPLRVQVPIKASLPAARQVRLSLRANERVVATTAVELGADTGPVTLTMTPEELGLQRFTVQIETVDGEVVPAANNHADVVVRVREDRVKVLFLDWLPRWETRFALNILQRLDYVELNAIVGIVQPEATLRRGVEKGTWPEDEETLAMYDLVVLGELPDGTLTAAELAALDRFVEQGKTICYLQGTTDATGLRLSDAGALHPLSRALGATVEIGTPSAALLATAEATPLIAIDALGDGKLLRVRTDRLWRWLNSSALGAHTALWANLVTWAVEATDDPAAGLGLDERTGITGRAFPVRVPGAADGTAVTARRGEQVVATATVTDGRAVFAALPAGTLVFSREGQPPTEPVEIVDDDPELHVLARDDAFLQQLATHTAASAGELTDLASFLSRIEPKQTVETREQVWRLWDSAWMLALLIALLAIEWIWRKLEGLV